MNVIRQANHKYVRRPWLWIIGAVINALVMLLFFRLYQDHPAVMFSPGGIVTKIGPLLVEATLIYLIVTDWVHARSRSVG